MPVAGDSGAAQTSLRLTVTRQDRDLEKFLEDAPWTGKWVHECAACHEKGYKPEIQKSDVYNRPVGSNYSVS